jgi:hypothetical protein
MRLTEPIKAYLKAAREARYLFTQVVLELQEKFGLTPHETGIALAIDLREQG